MKGKGEKTKKIGKRRKPKYEEKKSASEIVGGLKIPVKYKPLFGACSQFDSLQLTGKYALSSKGQFIFYIVTFYIVLGNYLLCLV